MKKFIFKRNTSSRVANSKSKRFLGLIAGVGISLFAVVNLSATNLNNLKIEKKLKRGSTNFRPKVGNIELHGAAVAIAIGTAAGVASRVIYDALVWLFYSKEEVSDKASSINKKELENIKLKHELYNLKLEARYLLLKVDSLNSKLNNLEAKILVTKLPAEIIVKFLSVTNSLRSAISDLRSDILDIIDRIDLRLIKL